MEGYSPCGIYFRANFMIWFVLLVVAIIGVPLLLLGLCVLAEWIGLIPVVVGGFGLLLLYPVITGSAGAVGGLSMIIIGLTIRAVLTVVRNAQLPDSESVTC